MRTTGSTILLLAVSSIAWCDEVRIPAAGRPSPFYDAAGRNVKVIATISPDSIQMGQSLLYTLTIRGLIDPQQMKRPDLQELAEFSRDFQIDEEPSPGNTEAQTRVFQYRLRPRRVDLTEIPRFEMSYYDPDRIAPPSMPGFSFRKIRTEALKIYVQPAPVVEPPVIPLDIPAFAKEPPAQSEWKLPVWAALGMPLVLSGLYLLFWTWRHPGAQQLRKRQIRRAGYVARTSLRTSRDLRDLELIIDRYLTDRYGASVPHESLQMHRAWKEQLQAYRFSPVTDEIDSMWEATARLLKQLESAG